MQAKLAPWKLFTTAAVSCVALFLICRFSTSSPEALRTRPPLAPVRPDTASLSLADTPPALPNERLHTQPSRANWRDSLESLSANSTPWSEGAGEERTEQWFVELQSLVESLDISDLSAAAALIRSLQAGEFSPAREELESRIVRRWAESAPRAAAEWARSTNANTAVLEAAVDTWARQDLSAAMAWTDQLPPSAQRNTALRAVMYHAAYQTPQVALELLDEILEPSERVNILVSAIELLTKSNPENAIAWVRKLPTGDVRERAMAAVAVSLGDADPARAASFAMDNLQPGNLRDAAVLGVVQRWVAKDVSAASRWVTSIADEELRELAIERVTTDEERAGTP